MVAVPVNGVLPDTKELGPNVNVSVPMSCFGHSLVLVPAASGLLSPGLQPTTLTLTVPPVVPSIGDDCTGSRGTRTPVARAKNIRDVSANPGLLTLRTKRVVSGTLTSKRPAASVVVVTPSRLTAAAATGAPVARLNTVPLKRISFGPMFKS